MRYYPYFTIGVWLELYMWNSDGAVSDSGLAYLKEKGKIVWRIGKEMKNIIYLDVEPRFEEKQE